MAKRKRKSGARGKSARAKQQVRRRLLASSATLFAGILLLLLAFVDGQAAWHTVHDLLFGIFGAGSFVLGPAVCYMAVLTAQDRPVLAAWASWRWDWCSSAGRRWSFRTSRPRG